MEGREEVDPMLMQRRRQEGEMETGKDPDLEVSPSLNFVSWSVGDT